MPVKGFNGVLKAGTKTVAYARDVELALDSDDIDVTTRNSAGWKEFLQGLKEWTLEIAQLYVSDDDAIQVLIDSWMNGTPVAIAIKDDADQGFDGTGYVKSLRFAQPLTDAVGIPATIRGTGALVQDSSS